MDYVQQSQTFTWIINLGHSSTSTAKPNIYAKKVHLVGHEDFINFFNQVKQLPSVL